MNFKLKHLIEKNAKAIVLIFLILNICLVYAMYEFCKIKEREMYTTQLQEYSNHIFFSTYNKLKIAAAKQSINLDKASLEILKDQRYINICSDRCMQYHIFKLKEILNIMLPSYIDYQLKLDNIILVTNSQSSEYTYNFNRKIGNNSVGIALSFNNLYINKINIEKYFVCYVFLLILDVYFVCILFHNIIMKIKTERIKAEVQNQYQDQEKKLQREIWHHEINKIHDVDLNFLMAQKANQISIINKMCEEEGSFFYNLTLLEKRDKLPCSIVLYQFEKPVEPISLKNIAKLIRMRFRYENKNIQFSLFVGIDRMEFVSEEALCQFLYSISHYLYFLLQGQSNKQKQYTISASINKIGQDVKLYFEYDGLPILTEQEFLNGSIDFFKTHANPFIMSPIEILHIFKVEGYEYYIGHQITNFLEINLTKGSAHNIQDEILNEGNVISIDQFRNKDS